MKKTVAAILSLMIALIVGCESSKPTPTPRVSKTYTSVVSVTGEVRPARWAVISSQSGGRVIKVLVEQGDHVAAGDLLVRLDTADLELSLQIAQQEVAAQQAALDRLLKGATEKVVARAERDNAQQVAQAEIALQVSQQKLEQARVQDPRYDVDAARAMVRQIKLQLSQARAQDPTPQVTAAEVELERAKIALDDAQDEYKKSLDRPWEDQKIRDALAKQLKQAQLNYRLAQANLQSAQNAQKAHAIGLQVIAAQLEAAQARLAGAIAAQQAYTATLKSLDAQVQAARLRLDYLRAWDNPYLDKPTEEEIAQARARLRQAELSVKQIERQIKEAEVRAPFDGTVGVVKVRVGEMTSPGQPLAIIGDLSTLRVETTDLDEVDVARVSLDQEATVTFDALPERAFKGKVTRISPMAEPGSGGVNYTVVIELEKPDPALRWGMTAFVDINVKSNKR